ncbi:MAG: type II secretion system protein [Patescibacteria group bacterium]|nr:type II secretion system protein [Patescibacteria group bacterium]
MPYKRTKVAFVFRRLSLSLSLSLSRICEFFSSLGSRYQIEEPVSSFTLIELLIVIAIIGILAAVVVLVLNPSQLLAQARDSSRIQEIGSLNNAVSMYLSEGNSSLGSSDTVYVSIPDPTLSPGATSTCSSLGLPSLPTGWSYECVSTSSLRKTDSSGWVPVDLQAISSGSPIPELPVDPINTTSSGYYYTYVDSGSNYEITAMNIESAKYLTQTENDGGNSANSYQAGNDLSLAPLVFPENWIQVPGNSTFGT